VLVPLPMPAPSIVVPGATTALVRRTTLRKAFLAPWNELVSDCWLYSLAYAQLKTDVAVHYSTLVINHHHTDVTPSRANLPEFTQLFHRDLSCSVQQLLAYAGFDVPHELFDDRDTHRTRLLDAAAQAGRLVYDHLNPVNAGLVQRPDQMPQRTLDFRRWKTGYIDVRRPPIYFSRKRPEHLRLRLDPPPLLLLEFNGDLDRLIHHMERLTEQGIRAARDARVRSVVGADELRRIHPWSEPRTRRETGPNRNRTFQLGAREYGARDQKIAAARETRWFRTRHADTRAARLAGETHPSFPYGTYSARVHQGAPTDPEPEVDAIVTAPGPLLCDVDTLRERDPVRQERGFAVLEEVRQAVADEAPALLEECGMDFGDQESRAVVRNEPLQTSGLSARPPARIRQRFDAPDYTPARRVVVHRDNRRAGALGSPRRGPGPPS